jgi:hypothetical protein
LAAACYDDDYDGYYWWDETNDVWCFTYNNGDTTCDDPPDNPRTTCTTLADDSRHCEVLDGGYVCVFDYAPDGTMTPGACIQISDAQSPARRDCEPANDGSLICQFQNAEGANCVVVFDSAGAVKYDPCGYFAT